MSGDKENGLARQTVEYGAVASGWSLVPGRLTDIGSVQTANDHDNEGLDDQAIRVDFGSPSTSLFGWWRHWDSINRHD